MRKISRIPAAIENEPNVVKNAMNALPASSAASIVSCLTVATSSCHWSSTGWSSASTRSESATAASPEPRFEIITPRICCGLS